MFDLLLAGVDWRAVEEKGNVFDFSFECNMPGVLCVTFTVADDENQINEFVAQITRTHDDQDPMVHVVNAVLDKPELKPELRPNVSPAH